MECCLCQDTGLVFMEYEDVANGWPKTEEAYRCNCRLGDGYSFARSIETFPFWESLKKQRIENREIEEIIKGIKDKLRVKNKGVGESKKIQAIRKKVDCFEGELKKLVAKADLLQSIHDFNPTQKTKCDVENMVVKIEMEEIKYLGYLQILKTPEAIEDIKVEIMERIETAKKQLHTMEQE